MRPSTRHGIAAALGASALLAAGGAAVAAGPIPPAPPLPGLPVNVPPTSRANPDGVTTPNDLVLETLSVSVQDPTALDVAPDGRVLVAERQGAIKVIAPTGSGFTTKEAGRLLINATGCLGCAEQTLEEGGIHGLELAADFVTTGRFYVYYSPAFAAAEAVTLGFAPGEVLFRLSTFVLKPDNTIDPLSEKVLLSNPAELSQCCHYGGDIDLMADGTLVLSVGDDTSPRVEGYGARDNRPGLEAQNAERTSQNKLDRRGKVLRLMPDGSVPDGSQRGIAANPHVKDRGYDPYVYAMGFRSDYRVAVDSATGSVFVGNVGPDATADNPTRGRRGHDELEIIPPGGGTNHGWPRCLGPNWPYKDYDYVTATSGQDLSCKGMTPAAIYYPAVESPQWEELGTGGRTAVGGVVYRYAGMGPRALPHAYQGKLFMLEYSRSAIFTIPVTRTGGLEVDKLTKIVSGINGPLDAEVGPDGAVYLSEYGVGFYVNSDSRISRLVPRTAPSAVGNAPKTPVGTGSAPDAGRSLPSTGLPVPVVSGGLALLLVVAVVGWRRRRLVP